MKLLNRKLMSDLVVWTDRSVIPPWGTKQEQEINNAVCELNSEIEAACFDEDGERLPESELTMNQRRALALATFSSAVPADGLAIGVLVNQPELIKAVLDAAHATKSKVITEQLEKVNKLLPASFWKFADVDARYEWLTKHQNVDEALNSIEESQEFEAAREDMMRIAAIIALDNSDEFFRK
jgi:hypothetical protein